MVDLQIPLPGLARDFNTLTTEERDFIQYFAAIDNTDLVLKFSLYDYLLNLPTSSKPLQTGQLFGEQVT